MRQLDNDPAHDPRIQHFAQINQRDGFFIAARLGRSENLSTTESVCFDWKSLENKRIIADHLFQPMATLKYVLNKQGANLQKIKFINAGNVEQSQAAFLSGEAEFIHLQGPYPQQLEADGNAKIVASVGAVLGNIAYSSLCATSSWLASSMAAKFMLAYKEALNFVQETDAELLASKLSSQFESIKPAILCETIKAYKALGSWSKDACISADSFESANKVFLYSGDLSKRVGYERVVSTVFC
jgi:NitT/TauT family transport system substrate-binding protein